MNSFKQGVGFGFLILVILVFGSYSFFHLPISTRALLSQAAAPTTGLIASYTFDDGAAVPSGATSVAGKFGSALQFDGVDDYASGAGGNVGNGNFSISLWYKTAATTRQILLAKSAAAGFFVDFLTGGQLGRLYITGPGGGVSPQFRSTKFSDDAWHHLVFTVDKSTAMGISLYLDGTKLNCDGNCSYNVSTVGDLSNTANYYMGASGPKNNPFTGSLDEVKIYDHILTSTEIQTLYTGDVPQAPPPATPPPADTTPPDPASPPAPDPVFSPITLQGTELAPVGGGSQQAFWNYYNGVDSPEGAYMGWIFKGATTLEGKITLPRTLGAGTYYVFLKGITYNSPSPTLQAALGTTKSGAAVPDNRDANKYWTKMSAITLSAPSNILTVILNKTLDTSDSEKFLLRSVYITDDPNASVDRGDISINLTYPTVMDTSPPIKGNLIENSNFETGVDAEWGTLSNNLVVSSKLWDSTQGYKGSGSLKLPLSTSDLIYGKDWVVVSRVFHAKPNKKYTFSGYFKVASGQSARLSVQLHNTYTPPAGYTPQPVIAKTVTLNDQWQRVSLTADLLEYPSSDYHIYITTDNGWGQAVWMDAVQLEEGDLSDYAPAPFESGMTISKTSNLFYDTETPTATLITANNTSSSKTGSVSFEVFDYLNKKVNSGKIPLTVAANSVDRRSINLLSSGIRGTFRVSYWVDDAAITDREMVFGVVPQPAIMGADPTSYIGIHAQYIPYMLEALQKMGIKWSRAMSPAPFFRWERTEPVDDQFVWHDSELALGNSYGITTMGGLGTNFEWPKWADVNGLPNLDKWQEYVGQIVTHYKGLVKYWEVWNEPVYVFQPAFYAQMLKRAADAIEAADPNAIIIGMGGVKTEYMISVIKEMEKQYPNWDWKQHIDILAAHSYPNGLPQEDYKTQIINVYGKPVWNTEAGAWDHGFYTGVNSNFISWGTNLWPHLDAQNYYTGYLSAAEALIVNYIRTIGNGMTNYFYYDGRVAASPDYYPTHTTIFEYDGTIRSKGIAYSIAAHFTDHATIRNPLNVNSNLYAYSFEKNGNGLIVAWTKDRSNKTLTFTSSSFTAYDLMGNPIPKNGASIKVGRTPVYIVGNGLSGAALDAALGGGSVAPTSDTTAPSVSISDAPRGSADTSFRIRWIGIDETSIPSVGQLSGEALTSEALNPNAILYSYHLSGYDNWSGFVANTFKDYKSIPKGNYIFEVKAKDTTGNISTIATRAFAVGDAVAQVVANPVTGDFNKDGVVNSVDLSLLIGAWGTNNAVYDLTKDGTVNTLDYTLMVKNWSR